MESGPMTTPPPGGFVLEDASAETPLRQSILAAADKQPDQHAKILALSQRTGIPASVVERNFEAIQKRAEIADTDYSKMIRETPHLANFLSHPDNAAVAKDDHEQLGALEKLFDYGKSLIGGAVRGTGEAISGLGTLNETAGRSIDRAMGALGIHIPNVPVPWWLNPSQILRAPGQTIAGASRRFEVPAERQGFGTELASSLGQLIPMIGALIVAGPEAVTAAFVGQGAEGMRQRSEQLSSGIPQGQFSGMTEQGNIDLTKRPRVHTPDGSTATVRSIGVNIDGQEVLLPTVSGDGKLLSNEQAIAEYQRTGQHLGKFATPEASNVYAEALHQAQQRMIEADPAKEDTAILAGSAIAGLAGEFGIEKLLERVPPQIKNAFLRRLADVTLSGGYQAGLQVAMDLANNVATKLTINPDQQLTGDLTQQALLGGATGAIARGILGVALPDLANHLQKIERAKQGQAFFQALGEGVNNSKTFQRLPQKLQELVLRMTKDGPIENTYLPVEDIRSYAQSQNMDPGDYLESITPGGKLKFTQAAAVDGADVEIPIGDYATKIAATDAAKHFNDAVRLGDPEAMNAREAEQFAEEAKGNLASSKTPLNQTDLERSAGKVREDIVGQMTGMGFMPSAVDAYARLYESAFRTIGERSGQDPFSLYEPYKLKITRPLPEVLSTMPDADTHLDPLIDQLRAGKRPSQEEMFGKSLVEFIREKGGVKDEGGDLASREIDAERKPFQKRVINNETGLPADTLREAAAEAGYLPKQSSINDFLDAIDKEVRGEPVYAQGEERPHAIEQGLVLEQLDSYLKSRDIDVQKATNAEIKAALKDAVRNAPDIDARTGTVLAQGQRSIPSSADVDAFAEKVKVDIGLERLSLQIRRGDLVLNSIVVSADERSAGKGTAAMEQIARYADDRGLRVVLNAATSEDALGTTSRERLVEFYKRFGFVENKGRGRDLSISDEMVRDPKKTSYGQELGSEYGLQKRGRILFGDNRHFNIELLEKADLSTFLHESGHFYLEIFGDVADELSTRPGELSETQQRMVDDYGKLLKQLGVESRDKIGVDQHEQFARSFEAYLREGKAPSPELRSIFQRFKGWLVNIYRSLKQLNVDLNPEVTAIFDRLLASDEEIARAQDDAKIRAMIEDQGQAERLGLNPEEFRAYAETVRKARDGATDQLDGEYLDEYNRAQSDWFDARRKEVRAEVASEVHEQTGYKALSFLKDGTLPDGSPLPEGFEGVKLDAAALEQRYEKYKDSSIMKQLRNFDVYRREGGVHPDQVADIFGYSSGDEMIQDILKLRPMDEFIDAETTDRMRQSYGDMLTDGTAAEKARDAVMTEGRSKVIEAEMKALAKKVRETAPFVALGKGRERKQVKAERDAGMRNLQRFVPSVALARDIAESRIADMKVRDVRPGLHYAAARREGSAAIDAVNRGDFEAALGHKQRELVNVEMYRAATDTIKNVEKIRDYMLGFDKAEKRQRIGKAGGDYLDQIDKLRERFDFSRQSNKANDKRASLLDFMKSEIEKGHELDIPLELQNEAWTQNYREMAVSELNGLRDAVKSIEHWANFKNKLLRNQAKRELDALAAAGAGSINGNSRGRRKAELEPRLPGADRKRSASAWLIGHRPLQSILREMDGFKDGFLFENIWRPAHEARLRENTMEVDAAKQYDALYNARFRGQEATLYQPTFIPELKDSLSLAARLTIALNYGNAGNRERLYSAGIGEMRRGMSEPEIQGVLNTLTKEDWEFVRGIADLITSYKGEIGGLYKRVTGVEPEWVEPTPFMTKHGEMPGWYYPIAYEDRAAALPGADATFADIIGKSSYMRFQTANGHTEARTQHTGRPLRADLGVIGDHLQRIIHDITHREMLIDTGRLLNRPELQDAIFRNYGDQYYKEIQSAFRDVAIGSEPPPSWYRVLQPIRRNYAMARLAWNVATVVRHVTNITSGMVRVGPKEVMEAAIKSLGHPKDVEFSVNFIKANSELMASRWSHRIEGIRDAEQNITANRGELSAMMRDQLGKLGLDPNLAHRVADSYLQGIHRVIQFAEIPTWRAAYRKALDAGREHPDAVASADAAILESFGGGDTMDLAAVQRSYSGKLFSTFMQYGLSLYRENYEIFHKDASVGRKIVDATLLNIVPVVILSAIFHQAHDKKSYTREMVEELWGHETSQLVYLRELAGALNGPDYHGPASLGVFGEASRIVYYGARTGQQFMAGDTAKAEKTLAQLGKEAALLSGEAFGVPANQVSKTMGGLLDIWNGKAKNPIAAVLFGPPPKR